MTTGLLMTDVMKTHLADITVLSPLSGRLPATFVMTVRVADNKNNIVLFNRDMKLCIGWIQWHYTCFI